MALLGKKKSEAKEQPAKAEKSTASSLEKRVTRLEAGMRILERQLGLDIDGDGKTGAICLRLAALVSVLALVGVLSYGYTVDRKVDSTGTQIYLLEDSGNLTIGGTVTSAGASTITAGGLTVTAGGLTVSDGVINLGTWSEATTADSVITNQAGVGLVTPGTSGATNTLAAPVAAGEVMKLVNIAANTFIIAESGNVQSAGAMTLGQYDTIEFVAVSTNWVEVSRSNN